MELLKAAEAGDEEKTKALLARGADVNSADERRYTALITAINFKAPGVAKLLVEKKANVNAANVNGATAMFLAA